jgi:putative ABC transport system ATP-binding protein
MNPNSSAAIETQDLSKVYANSCGPEVWAVKDICLRIYQKEVVLICGPNGSGKTTLLSLLGCLLQPSSGSIQILGREMAAMSEQELSRFRLVHIGFVFQHFRLLESLTAVENVELALNLAGLLRPESQNRAMQALASLGIDN